MFKKRYLMVIAGGLALAAIAFAEDGAVVQMKTIKQEVRGEIKTQRQELKGALQTMRQDVREKLKTERETFRTEARQKLEALKGAKPEEREKIKTDLKDEREALEESTKTMRENVKASSTQLRTEFREKVKSELERGRLAAAHGKGLRMLNRYRAAIARFDHIIGRLEARLEKLKARNIDVSTVTPMIEEAKNMKVAADADLEVLKAKYEDLLKGANASSTAADAQTLAKDLKTKLEAFHDKLKEIAQAIRAIAPKESDQEEGEGTATTTSGTNQ